MKAESMIALTGAEPVLPRHRSQDGLFSAAPQMFHFRPVRTCLVSAILQRLGTADARAGMIDLIVAPNGWGKTVAASQVYHHWVEGLKRPGLWLGINRANTGSGALFTHLIARLDRAVADARRSSAPAKAGIEQPCPSYLAHLLERLPRPFLICIDNLDYCTGNAEAGDAPDVLAELVQTAPAGVHLLVTANRPTGSDLTVARLNNRLWSHGTADLALTEGEARQILEEGLHPVEDTVLNTLIARTEGWAAGLRLGRLLLDHAPDGAALANWLSGDAPDLRSWFDHHVLGAIPAETQDFLYHAALFPHFGAAQMAEVAGIADAPQHLSMLLDAGMFIIPVSAQEQTYRFHSLFLGRLRSGAEQRIPAARRQECHRRMARWSMRQGAWQTAIDSAVQSRDHGFISAVLEQAAPRLVQDQGRLQAYMQIVDDLLAQGISLGVEARYWYAFALSFQLRHASADTQRRRLADLLDATDPGHADFSHRLAHLMVAFAFLADDIAAAGCHAQAWLDAPAAQDPFDRGWVLSILAVHHLMSYRFAEARECLRKAAPMIREAGSPYLTAWCELIRGTVCVYEGNLSKARQIVDATLAAAEQSMGPEAEICDTICAIGSKCAFEQGDHLVARAWLERGLRSMDRHGTVGSSAYAVETAIAYWNGDETASSFQRLETLIGTHAPRLALTFRCLVARRLVQLGRVQDAEAVAREIDLDLRKAVLRSHRDEQPARFRDLLVMTSIEVLHGRGDHAGSLKLAERELRRAKQAGRMLRCVRLELTLMSISFQTGRQPDALRHLLAALRQAERCGILQPFQNHRAVIAALVGRLGQRLESCFPKREERAFVTRVLELLGLDEGPAVPKPEAGCGLLGALSEREHELMQLVSSGMSNAVVARLLGLSENTVKWHLKNVFRKLDVVNRTSAVRRFMQDA